MVQNVLGSASGYSVYNNLINPFFASDFIVRLYPKTVSGLITSRDIVPTEITQTGDTVIFRHPPKGEAFNLTKNKILKVSNLNSEQTRLNINCAQYYNVKLDKIDERQIPNVQAFIDGFIQDSQQQMAQNIDREIFSCIAFQSHSANKGKCAGATSGAFNLGTYGSPVVLNKDNILSVLNSCGVVLGEANVDMNGRYIVVPVTMQSLLLANPILSQAYQSGMSESVQLMGAKAFNRPIASFDNVYFSNVLPRRWDDKANAWCYAIPFGMPQATGFIGQISENEIITQDKESFAKYWRSLFVYGYGVLRKEAVGVLYCTLDLSGVK